MNNLGIDLGRTIVSRDNNHAPFENCFEVISKLVKKFDKVYIVSRVNTEQRERAINWLADNDFYLRTGVWEHDVYFCFDRRDKAIFAAGLSVNTFIDDRPDVLAPMKNVRKILFNPWENDLVRYAEQIKDMVIVKNWKEVEKILI